MIFFPLMSQAFVLTADALYGTRQIGGFKPIVPLMSFCFGAWGLLLLLFFYHRRDKQVEMLGKMAGVLASAVAVIKYDLLIAFVSRAIGAGASEFTVGILTMVAIGAGLSLLLPLWRQFHQEVAEINAETPSGDLPEPPLDGSQVLTVCDRAQFAKSGLQQSIDVRRDRRIGITGADLHNRPIGVADLGKQSVAERDSVGAAKTREANQLQARRDGAQRSPKILFHDQAGGDIVDEADAVVADMHRGVASAQPHVGSHANGLFSTQTATPDRCRRRVQAIQCLVE